MAAAPQQSAAAKAKFTFATKLSLAIKAQHYMAQALEGEEERVGHDMIKCCSEIESGPGWDAVPLDENCNGFVQRIQQLNYIDVGKNPAAWKSMIDEPHSFAQVLLSVAEAALLKSRVPANQKSPFENFKFTNIGTSYLLPEKGWMVHVWNASRGARNFMGAWTRMWRLIWEYRIEGISCPFTTLLSLRGTYVSVTILPPVVMKKTPQVPLPEEAGPQTFTSYMMLQLTTAMGLPPGSKLPLYYATDGRYYLLTVKHLLSEFKIQQFSGRHYRAELFENIMQRQDIDLPLNPSAATDYIKDIAIPAAINQVVKMLLSIKKEEKRTVQAAFELAFLPKGMKQHGVNMCFLYTVLQVCEKMIEEEQGKWSSDKVAPLQIVAQAVKVEMMSRTLKQFTRQDIQTQVLGGAILDEDLLDAVNRVAKLATSANSPAFFKEHLLPGLRRKFKAPDSLIITPKDGMPMLGLRAVASRLGALYDPAQQKFTKFTTTPMVWHTQLPAAPPLEAGLDDDQRRARMEEAWNTVAQCRPQPSANFEIRKRVLTARAIIISLINQGGGRPEVSKAWKDTLAGEGLAEGLEDFERTRLAALHCEIAAFGGRDAIEQHLHLIRDTGTIPFDQPAATLMMLRAANAAYIGGTQPRPDLFEEALLELSGDAPWVSWFRCDIYHNSLKTLERQIPAMTHETVSTFHKVVKKISNHMKSHKVATMALRYEARVIINSIGAPIMEGHIDTHRLAVANHEEHHSRYNGRDLKTIISVYCTTLMALTTVKEQDLHEKIHGVLKLLTDDDHASAASDIARDWQTLDHLHRAWVRLLDHRWHEVQEFKAKGEEPQETFINTAARLLKRHLDIYGAFYVSLLLFQRVGRGYLKRKSDLTRAWHRKAQERKDMEAMEDAKRQKLARLKLAITKRLKEFFFARSISKTDEEYDTMSDECMAAASQEEYFAKLYEIYGEVPVRSIQPPTKEDGDDQPVPQLTPRAQALMSLPYEDIDPSEIPHIPTAVELYDAFMQSEENVDLVKELFTICDVDEDGFVVPKECYSLLRPLMVISHDDLDRIFLRGPHPADAKLDLAQFARQVMDTQQMHPSI